MSFPKGDPVLIGLFEVLLPEVHCHVRLRATVAHEESAPGDPGEWRHARPTGDTCLGGSSSFLGFGPPKGTTGFLVLSLQIHKKRGALKKGHTHVEARERKD